MCDFMLFDAATEALNDVDKSRKSRETKKTKEEQEESKSECKK